MAKSLAGVTGSGRGSAYCAAMLRRILVAPLILLAALLVPVPAAALESGDQTPRQIVSFDCSKKPTPLPLDLAKAAKLKVKQGKKGPVPLGMIGARQVAAQLSGSFDTTLLCSDKGSETLEATFATAEEAIAAGDMESAIAQWSDLVAMWEYVVTYSVMTRSRPGTVVRANVTDECRGLDVRRQYRPPDEVADALKASARLWEQAKALGETPAGAELQALATRASEAAQQMVTKDLMKNGADNAQSAGDWMAAATFAENLGIEGESVAFAVGRAQAAAVTVFKIQSKSKCPSPQEAKCLGHAIAAFTMMAGDDATTASMTSTWQKAALDALNPFKKKECQGELYEFQMKWTDAFSGTSGDTGKIRFRIFGDQIIFVNLPMVKLVDGGVARCAEITIDGVLDENSIFAVGKFVGGQFRLSPVESANMTQLTPDSMKLSLSFGTDALFREYWGQHLIWPPCGSTSETTEKVMSANKPLIDLVLGMDFARRENFLAVDGPVKVSLIYLCQKEGPWEPCERA